MFTQGTSKNGSMKTCSSVMSTRVKQRLLSISDEKVPPTEIHRLKAVKMLLVGVNRWIIKFRVCAPGKAIIVD